MPVTNTKSPGTINDKEKEEFTVQGTPNPSSGPFTLQIFSGSTQPAQIRISDALGRVVERKNNIAVNTNLVFGSSYRPGVYVVEVVQGAERRTLKLVKQ